MKTHPKQITNLKLGVVYYQICSLKMSFAITFQLQMTFFSYNDTF